LKCRTALHLLSCRALPSSPVSAGSLPSPPRQKVCRIEVVFTDLATCCSTARHRPRTASRHTAAAPTACSNTAEHAPGQHPPAFSDSVNCWKPKHGQQRHQHCPGKSRENNQLHSTADNCRQARPTTRNVTTSVRTPGAHRSNDPKSGRGRAASYNPPKWGGQRRRWASNTAPRAQAHQLV